MAVLDSIGRRNNALDLSGLEIGRLKVLSFAGTKNRKRFWLCRCACGVEKSIQSSSLWRGVTQSCGCLLLETVSTHRASRSAEYAAWKGIKRRCLNRRCKMYKFYGERGITVCKRWKDSFDNFIADVGRRPSPNHSIDRIDNDGNYEPGNVRWATREVQDNNKTDSNFVEFNGEKLTVQQWAKRLGIRFSTLKFRLARWGTERALTTTPQQIYRRTQRPRPAQSGEDTF
jgi:hypothetical protein